MYDLRFLVAGDLHYRAGNPPARLDNYAEAITAKLFDLATMAENLKVNAVILPGDLTDSASIALSTVGDLALILQKFTCPVLTIPGGHDEFGHNPQTISRTPYGLLSMLGFLECLHEATARRQPVVYHNEQTRVIITGRGYDADTDRDLEQYALPEFLTGDPDPENLYIHVVHGLLIDEDPGGMDRFTPVSRLAEIPPDRQPHVLISGHYHFGLKPQKIGRILVINPGALARVRAHVQELARPIQVALLRICSPEDYTVDYLPLPSAQLGEAVLSREHIEIAKVQKKKMDRFMALLTSEGEGREDFSSVREIVEDVAAREKIPEPVKKGALEWLSLAGEELAKKKRTGVLGA